VQIISEERNENEVERKEIGLNDVQRSTDTADPMTKSHNPNSNRETPEHKMANIATFVHLSDFSI
jgi:hypothetical protein